MGIFGAAHGWGEGKGGQKNTSPSTMVKLGTVIPYLKKIKKIYKSRDTPLTSADISIFPLEIKFVISRNTDIDCILVHNF